jgi:hypothetical protein
MLGVHNIEFDSLISKHEESVREVRGEVKRRRKRRYVQVVSLVHCCCCVVLS